MLATSRFAARERRALTPGRAMRVQRLADHGASSKGPASELGTYWMAFRCNLARARRRLLRASWLQAQANNDPRPPPVEEPPEEAPDDEDPPAFCGNIDRFTGKFTGNLRGDLADLRLRDALQQALRDNAFRRSPAGCPHTRPEGCGSR